jgi:hypothetical protein
MAQIGCIAIVIILAVLIILFVVLAAERVGAPALILGIVP